MISENILGILQALSGLDGCPVSPVQIALFYATEHGLPVFPTSPVDKSPLVEHGFHAATTDANQRRAWWQRFPAAMIGCPTGAKPGFWVLDVDGDEGRKALAEMEALHGPLPDTLCSRTPRKGSHHFFALPAGRAVRNSVKKLGASLDVRGCKADGSATGYIVLPGSVNGSGLAYTWESSLMLWGFGSLPHAPEWLEERVASERPSAATKPSPGGRKVVCELDHEDNIEMGRHIAIHAPASVEGQRGDDNAVQVAMRIIELGVSREACETLMWDHFMDRCENSNTPESQNPDWISAKVESAWNNGQNDIGSRSMIGAIEPVFLAPPPLATTKIDWPECKVKGVPLGDSELNIARAVEALGVELWQNEFTGRCVVEGLAGFAEFTDAAETALWLKVQRLGLRPKKDYFRDVIAEIARRNSRHPLKSWLAECEQSWDGTKRLGSWLSTYAGAPDTPLNRAFGRKVLVAAVRRIRNPGCKFDTMLVLEGAQGASKSSLLLALASQEMFSDTLQLDLDPKGVIEQTQGKWIIEAPELSGLARRDTEVVKAMLSRQVDRARMSYARRSQDVPRQFIIVGTTNAAEYLRDTTGNRRFWPVAVGKIDLAAFARDRSQLWAEAARAEAAGERLVLDEALFAEQARTTTERQERHPFFEALAPEIEGDYGFVPIEDIRKFLTKYRGGGAWTQADSTALGAVMRQLGFGRKQERLGGKQLYLYRRSAPGQSTGRLLLGQEISDFDAIPGFTKITVMPAAQKPS